MSTILGSLLGGTVTRAHTPQMMELGLRKIYGTEYKLHDQGYVERIYNMAGSEKKTESDIVTAALGLAVATPEGGNPTFDAMQEVSKQTYTHVKWTLGCIFTEEAIEDNLYWNLMQVAGKELAMSMAYTRTVQAFDIFNNLSQTVYSYGGSNYGLLSTAHPLVTGDTWANRQASALGLSLEALELYIQRWMIDMVDHRNRKYNFRPALLHVGALDAMLAERLLQSEKRPMGADNDINPLRSQNIELFVNPHLNTDGRWFLHAAKQNTKLVYFDRKKAGVKRYDNNDNGDRKFVSSMRNSHGAAGAEGISGSPGV